MLYVKKTQSPRFLEIFVRSEIRRKRRGGYANDLCFAVYGDLQGNTKTKLKEILFDEQRGLCCYCMQKIEREKLNTNEIGIEHFLPRSIFHEAELDYFNLYLTCKMNQAHCDARKGSSLIVKLPGFSHGDRKCEDFFRFNISGFILPYGSYTTIEKCYQNYKSLNAMQKGVLLTIDVLNLNEANLRDKREKFIANFLKILERANGDKAKLKQIKTSYEEGEGKAFAGVALYFLKQKLQNIP